MKERAWLTGLPRSRTTGIQRSAPSLVTRGGMIPTSVVGTPLRVKVLPTILGSRLKCPAQERGNSEHLEHVCSYISAVELLGALAVEVENVLTCSANHRVEDMVLFLIIQKFIIAKE